MYLLIVFISFFYSNSIISDEEQIKDKLNNQVVCWNAGNLECFMRDYWKSEELVFIGKSGVTYGWEETLSNYQKNYPDEKHMGKLQLEIVELDKLGTDLYFMVGKWQLTREVGDLSGHFSLVWKRIDNNWVIISDHSS